MATIMKATFGAGCFWGVEDIFRHEKGVIDTQVGYMGGKVKNPRYEDVCTDETGHAEVCEVAFDPEKISYTALVELFFKLHDPTQINRQGPDMGTQYRSVIFYHSEEQKKTAQQIKDSLGKSKKFKTKIATSIESAAIFYPAEEYHQQYFSKRGIKNTCHFV